MKKTVTALLALLLLTGCGVRKVPDVTFPETISLDVAVTETTAATTEPTAEPTGETTQPPEAEPESIAPRTISEIPYESWFDSVTEIQLSDEGILVDGGEETDAVYTSYDIIYYNDVHYYESGNLYGEGTEEDWHSAEEAGNHMVVNITEPGAYQVSGTLSAGQICIDLGEDAYYDEDAVVELILEDADITCTVAPAILFLNTYECDSDWSAETAQAEVDTSYAGANLILEGNNFITGSYVPKIYKDTDEQKKLWKQDGAIYSYMSMNVYGPGSLELIADNEGLDTELHLTINGGDITIYSGNDGINTNEDGVSVTTINGSNLTIFAGLGEEGDGIDSNGYLVINGGNLVAAANPRGDAGLDSDLGSYINGGTVVAMGSTMDWAESDSEQVTLNLQFAQEQEAGSKITVAKEDGTEIFSFESDSEYAREYCGLILSHTSFQQDETYHIYIDGEQMAFTGTDMRRGGRGGWINRGERPTLPEGETWPEEGSQRPEGWENMTPPDDIMPEDGFGGRGSATNSGGPSTEFYMNDKVNAFSGVTTA